MRWEKLFADLEGRARAMAAEETRSEIADRTRGETAQVHLINRLRAQLGRPVSVHVIGAGAVLGTLRRVGPDHLLLDAQGSHGDGETLLLVDAVVSITDLGAQATAPGAVGAVESRLGLGSVLREVTADRSAVTVTTRDGSRRHGTLARVGADWVDLLEHARDDVPRADRVARRVTFPFASIASVRREAAAW